MTDALRAKVAELNFNSKHIEVITQKNIEGEMESLFMIEGDILMSPESLKKM